MTDLTTKEMDHYNELSEKAKHGALKGSEPEQWRLYAERYAVQLEREGREYRAKRADQMTAFLAEKKAWADARDAHELAEAQRHAEYATNRAAFTPPIDQPEATFSEVYETGPVFALPEPPRSFNDWLAQKGLA